MRLHRQLGISQKAAWHLLHRVREAFAREQPQLRGTVEVDEFLRKLSFFADWFPEHRRDRVFGAVAYLKADESVTKHAERQGLFVIRATGSSASIVNAADFKSRAFPPTLRP